MIKLEWETNPIKTLMTWEEANQYAFSLMFDWRLPTREELVSAFKNKINGFEENHYWSSSDVPEKYKYRFSKTHAVVHLRNGFINYKRNNDLNYVRCVREIK